MNYINIAFLYFNAGWLWFCDWLRDFLITKFSSLAVSEFHHGSSEYSVNLSCMGVSILVKGKGEGSTVVLKRSTKDTFFYKINLGVFSWVT